MTGLRHLTPARRALLLVLVVLALAIRAAIPAGWMPMAQADGTMRLVLCPGSGASPVMAGMAMGATSADGHRDPAAPAGEHDCPFAVTALAVDLADPIVALAPSPSIRTAPPVLVPTALPGRGLAAPPPPATGPPSFA